MRNRTAFAKACVLLGAAWCLGACDNSVNIGAQVDSGVSPMDLGDDANIERDASGSDALTDAATDAVVDAAIDAATGTWEDVDLPELSGMEIEFAIDSDDREHFVVGNSESLVYGTRTDGSLRTNVIDADVFIRDPASLAFDSANQPHVAYVDSDAEQLCYASWNGLNWDVERIEFGGSVTAAASLSFNSLDEPTIGFESGEPMLGVFLMTRTATTSEWTSTRLTQAGTFAHAPRVFFDSMDRLHIVGLSNARELSHAVRATPSEDPEFSPILTSSELIYYDVSMDAADVLHVVATESDTHTTTLRYAERDTAGWAFIDVIEVEDSVASAIGIAAHPTIGAGIAFGMLPGDDLHYASRSVGTWTSAYVSVDRGTGIYARQLAFDSAGRPHIAYQQGNVHVAVRR